MLTEYSNWTSKNTCYSVANGNFSKKEHTLGNITNLINSEKLK